MEIKNARKFMLSIIFVGGLAVMVWGGFGYFILQCDNSNVNLSDFIHGLLWPIFLVINGHAMMIVFSLIIAFIVNRIYKFIN